MIPCVVLGLIAAAPAAADRPNVVLILADDMGYGDVACHGNPHVRTPTLNKLATEAVRFDRFFVSPVCSPTRAALLTGRYPERAGVWGVTHHKEALPAEAVTLAEALKAGGYATGCFGKWHNGQQWPLTAAGQGFDATLGFDGGHWNNYHDTTLFRRHEPVKTKGFITDVLTDAAVEFIAANRDRPFFCYLPYNAPHSPYQAPDALFRHYKGRGLDDPTAAVYAMVENVDANVGRVLAKLDALKLAERTVVLFLTDNGPQTDRFNAGMRGRKGSVHEGGTRVPCYVRWPGRLAPRVVTPIAAHIDLMPTLLDLCGVPAPTGVAFDGRSLVPLLDGKADGWPDRTVFTHTFPGNRPPGPTPGAVRTDRYRAVLEGKGWQLYDMIADPDQKADLAARQPAVAKELAAAYVAWWADVSKGGFRRRPLPVGHPEHDPVALFAPQAYFSGGVAFNGKNGFANDWLTGWANADDEVWFELDVARGGRFRVELEYGCPAGGATVRAAAGPSVAEARLPVAVPKEVPMRHLAESTNTYRNREWGTAAVGEIELPTGPAKLTLRATDIPAGGIELKAVRLARGGSGR